MQKPSISISVLSIALCVSSGFQQGYINSVLNPPYVYIEAFVNETVTERFGVVMSDNVLSTVWSFLVTLFPIATFFGQFLAAWTCKRFGRKGTALISCALILIGTLMSSLSYPARSFEMIFIGRFIWSLGYGINAVNCTVWIVECAPTTIRGAVGAMQEFSVALGSLTCTSLGMVFSDETLWPWMFVPNVPLIVISVGLFMLVPESPVYILERELDIVKAQTVLARYHGISVDDPAINAALNLKRKKTEDMEREDQPGLLWIFNPFGEKADRVRVVQQAVWLGIVIKVAYVFSGARTLRAYSSFFLHGLAHFDLEQANTGTLIISILRVPFTLLSILIVDRLGRRLLMNASMLITVIALITIMVSLLVGDSLQLLSAISFAAVLSFQTAGLGSVSHYYTGELVPRTLLVSTTSILAGIEAICKTIVEFIWFPIANIVGVWSMLIFLVPSVFFMIIIWAMCPETSNRTVNEVLDDIARRKGLKVTFTEYIRRPTFDPTGSRRPTYNQDMHF